MLIHFMGKMWRKIIFYLAWILFSTELSTAFFTRPHVVTTNQGSKPTGATTAVASSESTVQAHSQNIQIPTAAEQHLPNYFSNYQTKNNQHPPLPSSQISTVLNQHLSNHFPNYEITNEQHRSLPSSQIPVAVNQHLSNHFPNHKITNEQIPVFSSNPLYHGVHPIQPPHNTLVSTIANQPQLFHPAAFHHQHLHPRLNLPINDIDHHLHPDLADYHSSNFDHRPFNVHDVTFDSHHLHPPIPHITPEHAHFPHPQTLDHILVNQLH